jgi:hypothetical protein
MEAPELMVKLLHSAGEPASLSIDKLFVVPEGIVTSIEEVGVINVQFASEFQAVDEEPVHVAIPKDFGVPLDVCVQFDCVAPLPVEFLSHE